MKIKLKSGGFAQTMHAVFDNGTQLTHWARSKDRTIAAFHRSNIGKEFRKALRAGTAHINFKGRFTIQTKPFVSPPKLAAA
jgi:antibiotic biosynthesis monooxygenase (ABM) superfamily enzyme